MEKVFKNFVLVLFLALTSMMTACGSDDEPNNLSNNSIIGTWSQTNDYGTIIDITFNSNQKGSIVYTYPSGSTSTEFFEYTYKVDSDGDATLNILSEECQLEGSYDVVITPNQLTLETWDNGHSVYRFKRK